MPDAQPAIDINKNAIRERAARFVKTWEGTTSETGEKQSFWNDFFQVFGIERRQVASFEFLARKADTGRQGWIDLLYPGELAVEHKSAGQRLDRAMEQLRLYLPSLPKAEQPWLLIVSDFERFEWINTETDASGAFTLAELPDHLELFWWMAGHDKPNVSFEDEEEANLKATALLAALHDELRESGYDEHALRDWMTRILFCLFADDTGVWDRALFHTYIAKNTRTDGSDLGRTIGEVFEVLDTPPVSRSSQLDEDLADFTYINGDLFADRLPTPSCNEAIRNALLEACSFNWTIISPAIFGSMFQNVMTPKERRSLGAHYTTEQNILKTIKPLFVDDLWAELERCETAPKLKAFHDKLASLTFMDPACGCGNFLVIAYREVRLIEAEAIRRIFAKEEQRGRRGGRQKGQLGLDLAIYLRVKVDQFYGIEIEEFPARIARTALYLIDHTMNRNVSAEFGEHYVRFPIPAAPHIAIGNALRMDWNAVLPAERADFVFGNPPFIGFRLRSAEQQSDLASVMPPGTPRRIDYVLGWYAKAIRYIKGTTVQCGFVSTNSITQGEQAPVLAGLLADPVGITYAHRTFAWSSEARGTAAVHVVIIGFTEAHEGVRRRLFDYAEVRGAPEEQSAKNINCYLVDAPNIVIPRRREPLVANVPDLTIGSKPNDDGGLIVEADEVEQVKQDPIAAKYLRRLMGSREFLRDLDRWCLWFVDATSAELASSPMIRRRLEHVKAHRLASDNAATNATAATPYLFWSRCQPRARYLAVPEVSSEARMIVPMAYLEPDVIATNKLYTIEGAPLWLFALLQSSMFAAWARAVGGRMKSDISISPGGLYNTFPFPDEDEAARRGLAEVAQGVLDARAEQDGESLAVMYDPIAMKPALLGAHRRLDRVVDALYAPRRQLKSDGERLRLLFARYTLLTTGEVLPLDV